MSKRVDKHVTLSDISNKLDMLNEEIKLSDRLDFGDTDKNGHTEKHDDVLAINRQLSKVKRNLAGREKQAVNSKYLALVKRLVAENDNDFDRVEQAIRLANEQVLQDEQSVSNDTQPDPSEYQESRPNDDEVHPN